MKKILITGALGQIGSELTLKLREKYGNDNVVATDIKKPENSRIVSEGIFEQLDATDAIRMNNLVEKYDVDTFIHLAALLSAVAEAKPKLAWDLNMGAYLMH